MKTVSIFVADSEFKVYLCELIDQQNREADESHFVTFTPRIQAIWDAHPWASRTLLPWPTGGGWKRQIGLADRIKQIQNCFAEKCEGADVILVHTYQIFSERINCVLVNLQRRFPSATIHVRLIPDGTLNLTRRPMTGIRRFPQWFNRLKWYLHPEIGFYRYRGDRLGADCDLCDRIYLPEGFPNEYDPSKVHYLQMPEPAWHGEKKGPRTALVLGTALIQTNVCSQDDMRKIAAAIKQQLDSLAVDRVLYKPHHKESADFLELWSPDQQVIRTSLCMERLVQQQPLHVVIGNCSTALMTTKLIMPSLTVLSVGLDVVESRTRRGRSVLRFRHACEKLGIECVPVFERTLRVRTVDCPPQNKAA